MEKPIPTAAIQMMIRFLNSSRCLVSGSFSSPIYLKPTGISFLLKRFCCGYGAKGF
jgi:hypothetical protein